MQRCNLGRGNVALGGAGNPAFCELIKRQCQAVYYAFDILWLNGRDARDLPLVERKKFSAESSRESPVRLAALVTWTGALKLFELVKERRSRGLGGETQRRQIVTADALVQSLESHIHAENRTPGFFSKSVGHEKNDDEPSADVKPDQWRVEQIIGEGGKQS